MFSAECGQAWAMRALSMTFALLLLSGCPDEPYELDVDGETGPEAVCDDHEANLLEGCLFSADADRVACRESCGQLSGACEVGDCEQGCSEAYLGAAFECELGSPCGDAGQIGCMLGAVEALGGCSLTPACDGGSACLAEWQALVGACLD